MIDKSLSGYFKAIGDIKSAIAGAANVEDALRECVHIIRGVSNAETAVIWYYDKNGDKKLHPIFAQGEHTFIENALSPEEGIVGKVFTESTAVFLPDGTADEKFNSFFAFRFQTVTEE